MSLDPRPCDRDLRIRIEKQTGVVNGIQLGPQSPLLATAKRALNQAQRVVSTDPIDPLGRMNKTERLRAGELEAMRLAGVIRAWYFESIALVLADRTRYHPDFLIISKLGAIELEEIKGFWRDDARVKIKVASRQFPHFHFRALRRARDPIGGWHIESIQA